MRIIQSAFLVLFLALVVFSGLVPFRDLIKVNIKMSNKAPPAAGNINGFSFSTNTDRSTSSSLHDQKVFLSKEHETIRYVLTMEF